MRIHQLSIRTDRLEELLEFYKNLLEFPLLQQTPDSLTFRVGGSRLTLERAEPGRRPFYHFAFNIPANQLPGAKAWAEARVPLIRDQSGQDAFRSDTWDANQFYFYDPAGNILELIARHTLSNASSRPFSAQSIENISEIGVVSDDVPATVRRLQALTQAPFYHADFNPDFMPLGDAHGLFIVVRRGRVWFPETGKAAEPAPFGVEVSGAAGNVHTLGSSDV